jgi:hypothetical protein
MKRKGYVINTLRVVTKNAFLSERIKENHFYVERQAIEIMREQRE